MTVKDDLHQLVDALSDDEASLWLDAIRSGDPMLIGMAFAPVDDEPATPDEDAGADAASSKAPRRLKNAFRMTNRARSHPTSPATK